MRSYDRPTCRVTRLMTYLRRSDQSLRVEVVQHSLENLARHL